MHFTYLLGMRGRLPFWYRDLRDSYQSQRHVWDGRNELSRTVNIQMVFPQKQNERPMCGCTLLKTGSQGKTCENSVSKNWNKELVSGNSVLRCRQSEGQGNQKCQKYGGDDELCISILAPGPWHPVPRLAQKKHHVLKNLPCIAENFCRAIKGRKSLT